MNNATGATPIAQKPAHIRRDLKATTSHGNASITLPQAHTMATHPTCRAVLLQVVLMTLLMLTTRTITSSRQVYVAADSQSLSSQVPTSSEVSLSPLHTVTMDMLQLTSANLHTSTDYSSRERYTNKIFLPPGSDIAITTFLIKPRDTGAPATEAPYLVSTPSDATAPIAARDTTFAYPTETGWSDPSAYYHGPDMGTLDVTGPVEPTTTSPILTASAFRSAVWNGTEGKVAKHANSLVMTLMVKIESWDCTAICGKLDDNGECTSVTGCVANGAKGSKPSHTKAAGGARVRGWYGKQVVLVLGVVVWVLL